MKYHVILAMLAFACFGLNTAFGADNPAKKIDSSITAGKVSLPPESPLSISDLNSALVGKSYTMKVIGIDKKLAVLTCVQPGLYIHFGSPVPAEAKVKIEIDKEYNATVRAMEKSDTLLISITGHDGAVITSWKDDHSGHTAMWKIQADNKSKVTLNAGQSASPKS